MIKNYPWALAMIQPEPCPGSFRNKGTSFREVLDLSLKEVEMLERNGFDGYIIQNRNDAPVKDKANTETIAYMSVLGYQLKKEFPNMIQGILINWDGLASLAVADAIGSDFIRVEHVYTGVEVGYSGLIEAQCVDICNLRKKINSKVPVYADVQEVHYEQIGGKHIDLAAWDAIQNAFADGLFLGGNNEQESIEIYKSVRKKIGGNVPIFLSGGANGDNIAELMQYYDGVSVGTWVKNGNMKNPIDESKAKIFMEGIKRARKLRLKK